MKTELGWLVTYSVLYFGIIMPTVGIIRVF